MTGMEIAIGVGIGLGIIVAAIFWAVWSSRDWGPRPHDVRGDGGDTDGSSGPRGRSFDLDSGGDGGGD